MSEDEHDSGGMGLMIALMVIGAIVLLVVMVAVPNVIEARKMGGEAPAIGALKTISTAQSLYREADKDKNGVNDYGSLQDLLKADLIDGVLGSGIKHGYVIQVQAGASDPEFLWFAVANPKEPGVTGDRYFCTNQAGVVFYTTSGRIPMNASTCAIPSHLMPVGK